MVVAMARRVSPWVVLRSRPEVRVRLMDLVGSGFRGACARDGDGGWVVLLCRSLDQVERSATLAHELRHVDRGGGCSWPGAPAGWWAVEAREELIVDRGVARDLLPAVELDVWIRQRVEVGEQVDARLVSVEWAVPERIARIALEEAVARARVRAEACVTHINAIVRFAVARDDVDRVIDELADRAFGDRGWHDVVISGSGDRIELAAPADSEIAAEARIVELLEIVAVREASGLEVFVER
jgi:hypothetical protein